MPITNAEKQRRWREKRNRLASLFDGNTNDIARDLLWELGYEKAARRKEA